MFKGLCFLIFYIWFFVALCSIFFGPLVGLNRKNLRRELLEFFFNKNSIFIYEIARMVTFGFAYVGFLLPVSRPIFGLVGATVFFLIYNLISRGNI